MSPSRVFIERPIATTLLVIALVLVGVVAYRQLPVSALPQVDYPTIQIMTFYPGGSPDVMSSSVTAPLERQFGQIPGLSQMTSTSSFGSSLITLQFNLDQNIDVAEQQVQAAINAGGTYLPRDLPNPPIYSKVNPADPPIITLAVTSDTLPLPKLEDLADTQLAQKISQLTGRRAGIDQRRTEARGADSGESGGDGVVWYQSGGGAHGAGCSNVDQAKGQLDGPRQSLSIGANDQLFSSKDYKDVIIAYQNGGAIRLSDVANVIDGVENSQQAAWMNTRRR